MLLMMIFCLFEEVSTCVLSRPSIAKGIHKKIRASFVKVIMIVSTSSRRHFIESPLIWRLSVVNAIGRDISHQAAKNNFQARAAERNHLFLLYFVAI